MQPHLNIIRRCQGLQEQSSRRTAAFPVCLCVKEVGGEGAMGACKGKRGAGRQVDAGARACAAGWRLPARCPTHVGGLELRDHGIGVVVGGGEGLQQVPAGGEDGGRARQRA